MYKVRESDSNDLNALLALYQSVAEAGGGIARSLEEIDSTYIEQTYVTSKERGVQFIIDNPAMAGEIIAEIHCYTPKPAIFSHIFSELTIVVHPQQQGKGLGKFIFSHLLYYIENERPDILRVELFSMESNTQAITLYQKLGFVKEGRFDRRIKNSNGELGADTPMAWFNKNYKPVT